MTLVELRALVDEVRCRDTRLGAILAILLDKVAALDREIKELHRSADKGLTVTSHDDKLPPIE
jgi:hypothetical protein